MEIKDFKIYRADISMLDQFVNLKGVMFCGVSTIQEKQYRRLFQRSNARIYGLWYKEQLIVSAVIILKEHKKKCHLISLLINPMHAGITIAMATLSGIENECAHLGYTTMYLECSVDNSEAYTCFAKRAFFTYDKIDTEFIRMQKLLNAKSFFNINKLNQVILAR